METLKQLRNRAAKHGLRIRKNENGFMVVDARINGVVSYPNSLPLEEIEKWLDDFENANEDDNN